MAEPTNPAEASKRFLDVGEAEVVHGPDVIADKVSSALKDADRFGLPNVKPPLSDALSRAKRAGGLSPGEAGKGPAEQDALSGNRAEVDQGAGSAETLKPAERADRA
jgi:hypothetical protein